MESSSSISKDYLLSWRVKRDVMQPRRSFNDRKNRRRESLGEIVDSFRRMNLHLHEDTELVPSCVSRPLDGWTHDTVKTRRMRDWLENRGKINCSSYEFIYYPLRVINRSCHRTRSAKHPPRGTLSRKFKTVFNTRA